MLNIKRYQFRQIYKSGLGASLITCFFSYIIYSVKPETFSTTFPLLLFIGVYFVNFFRIVYGLTSYILSDETQSLIDKNTYQCFYVIINLLHALIWGLTSCIVLQNNGIEHLQSLSVLILIVGIASSSATVYAPIQWIATTFILTISLIPSLFLAATQTGAGFKLGVAGACTCLFLILNSRLFHKYYFNNYLNENKLKSQAHFLKKLIDSIPGIVSYIDENKKYRLVNQKLLEIIKLPESEIIDKNLGFLNQDDTLISHIDAFLKGSDPTQAKQMRINNKDFLVLLSFVSEKKDFLILSFDITREKQLENELESQNRKLEHTARLAEIGEITASIIHEINNAIFGLSLINDDTRRRFNKNELTQELIQKKYENTDRLLKRIQKIVSSLKKLSRKSSEKDPFEKSDLNEIIIDSIELAAYKLSKKSIQITNTCSSVTINCHPIELSQVVLNLINNATDALENTENPTIKIESEILTDNNIIMIKFTDNGPGISEDMLQKIMDPFFTTKESGKGTGLGLSISQKIISNHNGKLYLNSQYKSGAQFIIELPLNT